jgi:hypothetical protein
MTKRRKKSFGNHNGRKHKKTTTMACSDCGAQREISSSERYAAARIRCYVCGGPMNRPRDMRYSGHKLAQMYCSNASCNYKACLCDKQREAPQRQTCPMCRSPLTPYKRRTTGTPHSSDKAKTANKDADS